MRTTLLLIAAGILAYPQEKANLYVVHQIRQEALENSKVMDHFFWLTDGNGHRLTKTHHSNMDVYDYVPKSDLMQASAILASFVYHASTRDEMLPRKPLPKPTPDRFGAGGGAPNATGPTE